MITFDVGSDCEFANLRICELLVSTVKCLFYFVAERGEWRYGSIFRADEGFNCTLVNL